MLKKSILAFAVAAISATPVLAEKIQFSADAVQTAPGKPPQAGKLFVGEKANLFTYQDRGQTIGQVVSPANGEMKVLFHGTRTYFEFKGPQMPDLSHRPDAPCKASEMLGCKKTGATKVGDIAVETWEITPKGAPKAIVATWDPKRKMTIGQKFPNGASMISKMAGEEKYEALSVERWEVSMKAPNGQEQRGTLLFSKKLNMPVLEQYPNGMSRQLNNIQIGAQNAKLFDVPANFRRVDPPKAGKPFTTGSLAK